MIVDAHQHFWIPERGDYHWMPATPSVLNKPFLPADLRGILRRNGVEKTILVQAAQTEEETEFLLEVSAGTDFVAGVIGWLDFEDPSFSAKLDKLAQRPKFVGLRPMLQDLEDDAYIVRPQVISNLRRVAEYGLPFDFLTLPRHLPYAVTALQAVPGLRAVVDHISKPPIAQGDIKRWAEHMRAAAGFPNVYCKLSGMVTEADHQLWTPADLKPFVDVVLDAFGVDRLMFGSDWPVCLLAAEYGEVCNALRAILDVRIGPEGAHKLYGQNAIDFYKLDYINDR